MTTNILDPSLNMCFPNNYKLSFYKNSYSQSNKDYFDLNENFITCKSTDLPNPLYCNIDKYNVLKEITKCYNEKYFSSTQKNTFQYIRNLNNPFEFIGKSIFKNRAGVKLANIDAVFKLTNPQGFTFDNKQSNDDFSFCDIASGPGSFTQYLQYRFPKSKGYGITIRHKFNDWDEKIINMNNFNSYYGDDDTGDLYTNCLNFISFVLDKEPNGVNLVVGDGAFDITYEDQEFKSSRLLLTQVIVGISCTKINGNFVVKVLDTITQFSAQIIYILSLCFKSISLFKPISSRPANSERYLVCLNKNEQTLTYLTLLKNSLSLYNNDTYLKTLFSNVLPNDFTYWLTLNNDVSINLRLLIGKKIIYCMKYLCPLEYNPNINDLLYYINNKLKNTNLDDETKSKLYYLKNNHIQYDINKFLTIWNLPDNI